MTILEEGSDNSGYKRPAGSIKVNPVTVRVTSHSQPPLGTDKNHYGTAVGNNTSMIPPPTSGQNNNIVLNVKRPVVKMAGISFVSRQSPQPQPDNLNTSACLAASSTNPVPTNFHAKKPSIASETSPYMTQQKVVNA